ncbi:hypothetical protein [Streptomyces sp. KN37]|uniref:hypothetical protein n=1 Tax=Streptomyces sp. KN37 TaxID=3090667 RepID=UPI002A75099A|nr:hypothetical protein [Streptomyces sp. KN37]WPO70209.1 hypothetical protein R9806_05990 [Streptomyces sp. KN37]
MDVSHVEDRVKEIANVAADDERAHGLEDDLHCDVLEVIAETSRDPHARALAAAAIKTAKIEFERWCG